MFDPLNRFIEAQEKTYPDAFHEIERGKKTSHWMWFIFPQISGLGHSETARFYAIKDRKEAELYLKHPVLGKRLIAISKLLLRFNGTSAYEIFGKPDDLKLRSCMTLFNALNDTDPVFQAVIDQYFDGKGDENTLKIIQ